MSISKWIKRLALEVVQELLEKRLEKLERKYDVLKDLLEASSEMERTVALEFQRLKALTDEIDARIERGNQIWRQIRARERREEKSRELEEFEDPDQELLPFDGARGFKEGVPNMPPDVAAARASIQPHEEVARALAQSVARKGLP